VLKNKTDGRGRPCKEDAEKLKTRFSVALNDSDYAQYIEALSASGNKQSSFSRNLVMDGVSKQLKKVERN